jgi:hypothetical protein
LKAIKIDKPGGLVLALKTACRRQSRAFSISRVAVTGFCHSRHTFIPVAQTALIVHDATPAEFRALIKKLWRYCCDFRYSGGLFTVSQFGIQVALL